MLFDDIDDENHEIFPDEDDLIEGSSQSSEIPADIPTPRATEILIGHTSIEQQLLYMLNHHRFPHGLIFSGLEGVGKSVMAYRLARYLFSKDHKSEDSSGLFGETLVSPSSPSLSSSLYISPTDPVFARVASGGNPDLLLIERPFDEKTGRIRGSLPVEEIRKIAPFMRKTASVESGWRIVIVDDADTMTRSSQNSLLKILEEPPEKALLILIAHRAGALLPTIYSRCVHIPFGPLPDDDIRKTLLGRCPDHQIPLIISMAEGSLGAALEYADGDHGDLIGQAIGLLQDGQGLRWNDIQIFADFFGNKGNDDSQRIFKETMLWVASGIVRNKINGFDRLKSAPLGRKLKIHDDLRIHFDKCQSGNLDKRFLIMGAYMVFE